MIDYSFVRHLPLYLSLRLVPPIAFCCFFVFFVPPLTGDYRYTCSIYHTVKAKASAVANLDVDANGKDEVRGVDAVCVSDTTTLIFCIYYYLYLFDFAFSRFFFFTKNNVLYY